jgi:hypothetical protein
MIGEPPFVKQIVGSKISFLAGSTAVLVLLASVTEFRAIVLVLDKGLFCIVYAAYSTGIV